MQITPINPVSWSIPLGFDQAELVAGQQQVLICSGQDSVDADGHVQHPGDMGAQLELSLENLETVLTAAGMSLANVVRLSVYTTDMDELARNWGGVKGRFGDAGGRFATSLLGVSRLFTPELLVLLEATAIV
jgi:enamine deaminase RidA (YjgF/YER057c/UK114 family)